ncbi:MAG: iron donor protein CyaY [Gammaproteobacteria bacterium]|nr:iron donor protein CyaY [Gammaproteobacteria bacterium]
MTETEFLNLAEEMIVAIEDALDECEVDIDVDNVGEVLTLIFENKTQVIINKQTPLKQLWVAAKSGGYHFDFDEEKLRWVLDSDHTKNFCECLNQYCSEQAGVAVDLRLEPE